MPFSIHPLRFFLVVFASLITLLLLSNEPVYAEWMSIGKNDEGTTYIDTDTIRRNGGLVMVWTLHDYKTIRTSSGNSFWSVKGQEEYDCEEQRYRVLAWTGFSGSRGSGKAVSSNSTEGTWQPVVSESVGHVLWTIACAKTEGTGSKVKPDLTTALGQYNKAVGVFPKEFLRFSAVQQEAYLRGVLDGEYFLSEESKEPNRDAFVNCLNARQKTILSKAKSFVEREGEHNYLMPWTLSRLIGQSCPKETPAQAKTSPKYTEATTPTKLVFLQKSNPNETEFQREQAIIAKAFVRGVLDGKVFMLYGHSYSKLADYLECLSKPGNLDTIVLQRDAFTQFGENLDKSQAYGVAFTEALICKELNE